MFTQIGSVALFALAASESALGRPLLVQRQSSNSSIGNFGSCSVPEISFGVGFDNRKETSFEPTDQASYNHGSADNIAIITQFMCDNLVNSCKADATAQATCVTATNAAAAALPGTGGQADAFNAVFGIKTNFANIPVVSDQGTTLGVDGTNSVSGAAATSVDASATTAAAVTTSAAATEDCPAAVTVTVTGAAAAATSAAAESVAASSAVAAASATGTAAAASSTDSASIGNFGSCTVPQIQFGVGFDNRKETAFEPVDQTSYNHGSADNIAVITQFMCNTLTNTCNADATAKATCATATNAAAAALSGTGQQADAFNAVFGIKTNFANVPVVSNTGVTLGVDGTNSATAATAATTSA